MVCEAKALQEAMRRFDFSHAPLSVKLLVQVPKPNASSSGVTSLAHLA
jgi:hypothetical protein